jgi:hypothetical protein
MIWQCFPSMRAGIFGIRLRVYKSMVKTKLDWDGRRSWRRIRRSRSYVQKSFGMTAEKGNRLKDEKPKLDLEELLELLINVKGINVILHGLRPVSINRWTVLPYCSHWLGIHFLHHACTFTFHQSEGTFIICFYGFDNKNKLMKIYVLLLVFHICVLLHHLTYEGLFLRNLRPEFIISEGT